MTSALPYTREAYQLFQDGAVALAKIEATGIRVDERYLDSAAAATRAEIKALQAGMAESKVVRQWRRRFRGKTNLNSAYQLGKVLFEEMGFRHGGKTKGGEQWATGEDVLAKVEHPFARAYVEVRRKTKGLQFLEGIREETVDGVLHPNYNLNIARTYRSSSDSPNFQNIPVRDEWMRLLVRRAIRARKGRRLVEIDYQGAEVRGAYCYHRDPTMRAYLLDESKDMHRDMAAKCFKLKRAQVTKRIRYLGKNGFVFPEFYGSYWLQVAAGLWEEAGGYALEDGTPLKKHLRRKGITELGDQDRRRQSPREGTFEAHVESVERWFWEELFPVYAEWRRSWYRDYLRRGYLKMKTGFICRGPISRNDVINYPVQGACFHWLLQSLVWIVNEELGRRKMRAKVVGQIHDSIVGDVPDEEVQEYISLCRETMTERLLKHWRWITIPLGIEAEVSPIGGTWADKKEWVDADGVWRPKAEEN